MYRWIRPVLTRQFGALSQGLSWRSLGVAPSIGSLPAPTAGQPLAIVPALAGITPPLSPVYRREEEEAQAADDEETQTPSTVAGQLLELFRQQESQVAVCVAQETNDDNFDDQDDPDQDDREEEDPSEDNGQDQGAEPDDSDASSVGEGPAGQAEVVAAPEEHVNAAPEDDGLPAEFHFELALSSSDEDDDSVARWLSRLRPVPSNAWPFHWVDDGTVAAAAARLGPLRAASVLERAFPRLRSRYSLIFMPTDGERENVILRILYEYVMNTMELDELARAVHAQNPHDAADEEGEEAVDDLPVVPPLPAFLMPLMEPELPRHLLPRLSPEAPTDPVLAEEIPDFPMNLDGLFDIPPGPSDGAGDGPNLNDPVAFFQNLANMRRPRTPPSADGSGDGPQTGLLLPPFGMFHFGMGNRNHLNGVVRRVPPLGRGAVVGPLNVPLEQVREEAEEVALAQLPVGRHRLPPHLRNQRQAPPLFDYEPLPRLPGDGGRVDDNAPGPSRNRNTYTLPRNWPIGVLTRRQRRDIRRELNELINTLAETPPTEPEQAPAQAPEPAQAPAPTQAPPEANEPTPAEDSSGAFGDGPSESSHDPRPSHDERPEVIGDGNALVPRPRDLLPMTCLPRRELLIQRPSPSVLSVVMNSRPLAAAWLHSEAREDDASAALLPYGDAIVQHRERPSLIVGGLRVAPQILSENFQRLRQLLQTFDGELGERFRNVLMEFYLYATIGMETGAVSNVSETLKKILKGLNGNSASPDMDFDLRGLSRVPAFLQQGHGSAAHYEQSAVAPMFWYQAPDSLFGPARILNSMIHEQRGSFGIMHFIRSFCMNSRRLDSHHLHALKLLFGNEIYVLLKQHLNGAPNDHQGLEIVELPPSEDDPEELPQQGVAHEERMEEASHDDGVEP